MTTQSNYLYGDITNQIWNVFAKLRKEFKMRRGLSHGEICNIVRDELMKLNIPASREVPIINLRGGERIGTRYADLIVDSRVVVDVKINDRCITQEYVDQVQLYMDALGLAVGVVLNFGCPHANLKDPEGRVRVFRRLYLHKNNPRKN